MKIINRIIAVIATAFLMLGSATGCADTLNVGENSSKPVQEASADSNDRVNLDGAAPTTQKAVAQKVDGADVGTTTTKKAAAQVVTPKSTTKKSTTATAKKTTTTTKKTATTKKTFNEDDYNVTATKKKSTTTTTLSLSQRLAQLTEQERLANANYWLQYAKNYAKSIGLTISNLQDGGWDTPIMVEFPSDISIPGEDIRSRLNDYKNHDGFTVVQFWLTHEYNNEWELVIAYAG